MAANSLHYQILLSPVLTEKSTDEQARLNSYRFEVAGGANRIEIREAVEAIFDVKVKKVNVMVRPGKPRRRGFNSFQGPARKIAVVQLQEGQNIDLL
ncbi:MAG TPA: 50S ribosomal protein L23 [Planctomycetota bacterium]|jgi:large subunit ribosomal protein L23|nr:50S ribosomal protein L23 [Planctomycetota bacterium]MDP6128290.1 50S ribosomal protein L23 [Planctomycetota bacterium]MDP7246951.1 50S ribosomal protein L23 [Planctomycetota bacterium]MDP7559552.1 50S ribosomal protein L23 [Planctomycetota bacterium]HJM38965.1 50S ribosomal protein L23 [Planctomycetota bacterium]|tara:strand:+ start:49096 stop:49386 length:291 start_codon:yes stop_codon:yes gene_type:complete